MKTLLVFTIGSFLGAATIFLIAKDSHVTLDGRWGRAYQTKIEELDLCEERFRTVKRNLLSCQFQEDR